VRGLVKLLADHDHASILKLYLLVRIHPRA
jgi:hypothetical protein